VVEQATVEALPRYSTMETVEHRPSRLEDAEPSSGEFQASTGMDDVLEVRIFSLNSRKLVLEQLRMLAVMLGVTTKATSAQTRQLIEGKLLERGYEPRNVQVVVSQENGRLHLVNNDGIIAAGPEMQGKSGSPVQHDYSYTTAHVNNETMYVTDASHKSVESLRSALREARLENKKLQSVLKGKCNELERVSVEREA